MANKITQRDYFNQAIEVAESAGRTDLVEFFKGRIEALDKKNANRKPTKEQEANAVLQDAIVEVLEGSDSPISIATIKAQIPDLESASSQKVVGLIRGLGDKVVKTYDKKVAYFALAK